MIPRCHHANSGAGRVSGTAGEARTRSMPDRLAEAACRYVELARPSGREKERGMSSIPAIRLASFVYRRTRAESSAQSLAQMPYCPAKRHGAILENHGFLADFGLERAQQKQFKSERGAGRPRSAADDARPVIFC